MSAPEAPVVVAEFDLRGGQTQLRREFFAGESLPAWLHSPPDWLENVDRIWDEPQDPICFVGDVKPGHEAEAVKVMGVEEVPNRFEERS